MHFCCIRPKKFARDGGFTLIELLITLASAQFFVEFTQ
jgi:hypothetical protein